MNQDDIIATLARIDERTEHILNHIKKLNGVISEHDKEISYLQKIQERHSTYFKLIGALVMITVAIVAAVLDKLILK